MNKLEQTAVKDLLDELKRLRQQVALKDSTISDLADKIKNQQKKIKKLRKHNNLLNDCIDQYEEPESNYFDWEQWINDCKVND